MFSVEEMKKRLKGKKILVRGRAGKTKVFPYSEFDKDLLKIACDEIMIHNRGNLPTDGYYIATVKEVYTDQNANKRIDINNLKFLSESPVGFVDIEPHLYSSYQITNFFGTKVKTKPDILMLMMLLEGSIGRPITVSPQSYLLFAQIVHDYNKSSWDSFWDNLFSLQVVHYQTTRYPWIKELQYVLMNDYADLVFNYEKFVIEITGDILPTEESLKELELSISNMFYEDDIDNSYLQELLGDFFHD